MPRLALAAALMSLAVESSAHAQPSTHADAISYTLRFPDPQTHYVEVEARIPTGRRPEIDLMMAVWTPGSYLVREYERNVENIRVVGADGRALAVDKPVKNRWHVRTGGTPAITVTYRVYSHEMTVRNNWVEDRFALLNGAPTFLTLADGLKRPHEVTVTLPPSWKTSVSALPDLGPNHFRAPDFDTLVDSPIVAGNPAVYEFTVDGKRHFLVNVGEEGVWDGPRSARDVERIVRGARDLWGFLPYEKYVFFNLLTEAGGGLEHKNGATLMASRWSTRTDKAYRGWLGLVSHEFFHAWNVKRLRPVELGPFDYEHENYTRSLWIAEGLTDYYADVVLVRAGLVTPEQFLESVSSSIRELQITPGRLVTPVERASFDAWIKQYRPDENTSNTTISYYTKGSVVGLLLDAEIRRATNGAKSLDDAMRLAYQRYAGVRGYTPAEFRAVISEVAGTDLGPWLAKALETTEELDYSPMLEWYGLRFRREPASEAAERTGKGWLGLVTRDEAGRLLISRAPRETPGFAAGLNVDDEIVAIDDLRVRAGQLEMRLAQYRPGDKVEVLVARRDALQRIPVTLGTEPYDAWRLELAAPPSPHFTRWTGRTDSAQ
jgi:predicted metalloprotease with PDZ domain